MNQLSKLTDFKPKTLAETRFKSPRVSIIEEKLLLSTLVKLIAETYFKCGIKVDSNELQAVSGAFKEELQFFPYITMAEIRTCFNDGYKERYGKYYGLSVKTFVQWIDFYIENKRNETLNKLKPKETQKKLPEISEKEKQELISSGMRKCLDKYEENTSILDGYTAFLYQVLYDDSYLNKEPSFKKKMYDDAKTFLQMDISSRKAKSSKDHKQMKQDLLDIEKEKSPMVIAQAQKMIVSKFLRETYRDKKLVDDLKSKYNI